MSSRSGGAPASALVSEPSRSGESSGMISSAYRAEQQCHAHRDRHKRDGSSSDAAIGRVDEDHVDPFAVAGQGQEDVGLVGEMVAVAQEIIVVQIGFAAIDHGLVAAEN